jgi:ribosomal protein S2
MKNKTHSKRSSLFVYLQPISYYRQSFFGVRLTTYKDFTICCNPNKSLQLISKIKNTFFHNSHVGHNLSSINSTVNTQLMGVRNTICLFNYEKNLESLQIACLISKNLARLGLTFLFISTLKECNETTKIAGYTTYQPMLLNSFVGGFFTNSLICILPTVIFVPSTKKCLFILKEARRLNVPVLSINDTNTSSNLLSFSVIASDDSIKTQYGVLKSISYNFVKGLFLCYVDMKMARLT